MIIATDEAIAEAEHRAQINAEAVVARGVDWLDKVYPGWERQIDLDMFDIEHTHYCVLGHLFLNHWFDEWWGGYDVLKHYAEAAGLNFEAWSRSHGFHGDPHEGDIWVVTIKERFATGTLSDA